MKPFTARELLARVGTHLALGQLRNDANRRQETARAEVEAERARLRQFLMQAPAAISVFEGPEHILTLANPLYLRYAGGLEVLGKTAREAFPESAGQEMSGLLDQIHASGEPVTISEMAARWDRSGNGVLEDGWADVIFQPLKNAGGQVEGVIQLIVDVTSQVRARYQLETEVAERTRAEALLAGERAVLELIAMDASLDIVLSRLSRAIEGQSDGVLCSILVCDPGGQGFSHGIAPNLPNSYMTSLMGASQLPPYYGPCDQAAHCGEVVLTNDIETDHRWNGEWRRLALSYGLRSCYASPITGADRQVLGSIGVYYRSIRDPTPANPWLIAMATHLAGIAIQRKRTEDERAQYLLRERSARIEAETAVRARDEFLSIAAHELRTPVTAIKGTAQLTLRARERGTLDVLRAGAAVETIHQAVDRLAALIDDLLDVSRLQGGQLSLRPARIDIGAFLQGTAARFNQQIEPAHRLQLDLSSSVITVEADSGRLEQVLDNLLTNAVKYSPDGGVIAVSLSADRGGAAITVRDSGIGLPPGSEERIFEPFGRASNATSRNLPGLGLGLHVSRRIIQLHGGRLWAESAGVDRGTTMHLWLPGRVPNVTRSEGADTST